MPPSSNSTHRDSAGIPRSHENANRGAILSRRDFVATTARAITAGAALHSSLLMAQLAGERPPKTPGARVLNPRARVPVGIIIDDSTCLVNLNRFTMPQFDEAYAGKNPVYKRPWREWPAEIPDSFVRKFGEWAAANGVKGKYSIVPYPACVGRLDRLLPGWSRKDLDDSLDVVRKVMMPNWDIHPEMITHTRVIDLKTGQPYPEASLKYMENWDWSKGRSVSELADYLAYALRILKNVDLPCEGVTTPGGFGIGALPELSQATLQSVRGVFGAEIPHYFRDLYDEGDRSVAPRVEYASGLNTADPKCAVSIVGCTGDWTGSWDATPPEGADRFITEDLRHGRMVDVIQRGEPAIMVCHWTGVYWNGQELGFKIFQEVHRRLHARFNNLVWMKLSEVARYWAARELTQISREGNITSFAAPFACPDFTVELEGTVSKRPSLSAAGNITPLEEVSDPLKLRPGSWCRGTGRVLACFPLPKGPSKLDI